jgi:uncharacterized protein
MLSFAFNPSPLRGDIGDKVARKKDPGWSKPRLLDARTSRWRESVMPNSPAQSSELSVSTNLAALEALLDAVPAPLEPLDVSAIDGYLCGILLQPVNIPASRWLRFVTDGDGRVSTQDFAELHAIVRARHSTLERAISQRSWFDPWIFEMDDDDSISLSISPWVAGFALAMEHFPDLMALDAKALTEPLALLYRHLDPDDLEDADELLAEIDTLEPPAHLGEAVEELVRATLLLADVSRPRQSNASHGRPAARKGLRGRH